MTSRLDFLISLYEIFLGGTLATFGASLALVFIWVFPEFFAPDLIVFFCCGTANVFIFTIFFRLYLLKQGVENVPL